MKNNKSALLTILSSIFVLSLVPGFLVSTYDINNPWPLSVFIVIVALLLHYKNKIVSLVLIGLSLLTVHYTYFKGDLSFFNWLGSLSKEIVFSIGYIFSGQAMYIPTFIGFIVIELLIIMILMILIWYRNWKLPFIISVIYFATLIVLGYSGLELPLIALLVSTSLIALTLQFEDVIANKTKQISISLITILLLVISFTSNPISNGITSLIKYQTSSVRSNWQSSFFNFLNDIGEKTGIKLGTGFSENDDNLGGPINNVYTPVFTAMVSENNYWRIESKEFYTGRGWTTRFNTDYDITSDTRIPGTFSNYESEEKTITFISSRKGLAFLPMPYGDVTISFEDDFLNNTINYSTGNQRIKLDNLAENGLTKVTYKYKKPLYSVNQLQNSSAQSRDSSSNYTQLPDNLPVRVSNHAKKLTANATTDYDKVVAIVDHLSKSYDIYSYSLDRAEYVPEGEDYVDHFLFTSQIGYCEHFSSAAVVLLRSLNIEARWVKGYAPGTMTSTPQGIMANVNESYAHAWIEVYFDGVGWVPFETTPSFNIDVAPQTNTPTNPGNPQNPTPTDPVAPTPTDPTTPVTPTEPSNPSNPQNPGNGPDVNTPSNHSIFDNVLFRNIILSVLSVVTVGLLAVLYIFRKNIYRKYVLRSIKNGKTSMMKTSYLKLLKAIELKYPRNKAITLLEYSKAMKDNKEEFYNDFNNLTMRYYKLNYSTENDYEIDNETKEIFIRILTELSYK